jgi:UDP-N-acetylglucosamine:LPS N-acetylglucosamine transferase
LNNCSDGTGRRKVLAVASGGGHWVQLQRLRPALDCFDVAFVGVSRLYADDLDGHRFYVVRDVTRWDRLGLVFLAVQLVLVLIKERPAVVITTGSAPGLFALVLAKVMFRARTIWIDSIANCERMSASGLRARRFADVWLTQWAHIASPDGPQHYGAVL